VDGGTSTVPASNPGAWNANDDHPAVPLSQQRTAGQPAGRSSVQTLAPGTERLATGRSGRFRPERPIAPDSCYSGAVRVSALAEARPRGTACRRAVRRNPKTAQRHGARMACLKRWSPAGTPPHGAAVGDVQSTPSARALRHRRLALPDHADRGGGAELAPKEVEYTLALAREEVSVTRGGGTSQSGRTVNLHAIVDCSKHLDRARARRRGSAAVEPARADDQPARRTAYGFRRHLDRSRATIGGMVGNTCGRARCATATRARTCSRSTRSWPTAWRTRPGRALIRSAGEFAGGALARDLLGIAAANSREIETNFEVRSAGSAATISMRWRLPQRPQLAHSRLEGTLAFSTASVETVADRPARGRRLPFRQLRRGDGRRQALTSSSGHRRGAGRSHDAAAGARDRDVRADHRGGRARRS
jgi:hypothetical protein